MSINKKSKDNWLKKAKLSGVSSTSSFIFSFDGKVRSYPAYECYATLYSDKPIEQIFVWHRFIEECKPYVDFLINSKWLGHVFLTKNYEEGTKNGFEIDTNTPHNTLRGALICLRSCFEHPQVCIKFNLFKEMGLTDEEAFYFGILFRHSELNLTLSSFAHGIDLTEHVFLGDIISGKLWYENLPANICGIYSTSKQSLVVKKSPSDILGCPPNYLERGSVGNLDGSRSAFVNPKHVSWVSDIFKKHFSSYKYGGVFSSIYKIPFQEKNIIKLVEHYKKDYEIE